MPFTGGPSVRVVPNAKIEIRYVADFAGDGTVELFDNPDGNGTPIDGKQTGGSANDQTVEFNVGGLVVANTKYHVKVTHRDPNGNFPDCTNNTPLPPVFTGAQTLTDVRSSSDITTAQVSWDGNVIGIGSVMYGTTALDKGPVEDNFNIPNHAIALSGLTADTVYQFKACTKHAIDRTTLGETSGTFRTQPSTVPDPGPDPSTIEVTLTQPHAEPRVIALGAVSTLSVRALNKGNPTAGVALSFQVLTTSQGGGTLSSAQATTDANGIASVQLTANDRGNVHVKVSGSTARNQLEITVVVRHN